MGSSVQCGGSIAGQPDNNQSRRCADQCGCQSADDDSKFCSSGEDPEVLARTNPGNSGSQELGLTSPAEDSRTKTQASDQGKLLNDNVVIRQPKTPSGTTSNCCPGGGQLSSCGAPAAVPSGGTDCKNLSSNGALTDECGNYFDREKEELAVIRKDQDIVIGDKYHFKSGATYQGQWNRAGARHGYGKMVWADGVTYEGQWVDNIACGKGSFQHIDGDQYIGEWAKSMANGMGVYYHGGVQTYIGEWQDDFQHGMGIESWNESACYQGEFKKSQKEGFGRYRWEGGCEYVGRWTNNVIGGHGMCIASDGRIFMGLWRQSAMHGIGKYVWPDGKEYSGQYWFDKKDGFGVFKESNGDILVGFWTQGAPENCIVDKVDKCLDQGGKLDSNVDPVLH